MKQLVTDGVIGRRVLVGLVATAAVVLLSPPSWMLAVASLVVYPLGLLEWSAARQAVAERPPAGRLGVR